MHNFDSQELLKAVEQERSLRATPRNATIYNHSLGGFEVQRVSNLSTLTTICQRQEEEIKRRKTFQSCALMNPNVIYGINAVTTWC